MLCVFKIMVVAFLFFTEVYSHEVFIAGNYVFSSVAKPNCGQKQRSHSFP